MLLRQSTTARETHLVSSPCDVSHQTFRSVSPSCVRFSIVMYIPAVPYTPTNAAYIAKQKESFLQSVPPPDYPFTGSEAEFVGTGTVDDVVTPIGRRAMGLADIAIEA